MSAETECIRIVGMCTDVASFWVEVFSAIFFAITVILLIRDARLQGKSLLLNARAHEESAKVQFATLLNQYLSEHSELLQNEPQLKDRDSCENHAIAYGDFFDRIAYLCLSKRIDESIGDYFKTYFDYVQLMLDWYDKIIKDLHDSSKYVEKRWGYILQWCEKKEIKPRTEHFHLPPLMEKDLDEFYKRNDHKDASNYFGSRIRTK